jgi:hypothetical protein
MFVKTTLAKAPKRTRVRACRFEITKECKSLLAAMEKGLKPTEVLRVCFTEADMQKYRITNRRTVARYVRKYIDAHKLPYVMVSFQNPQGGFEVQVSQ